MISTKNMVAIPLALGLLAGQSALFGNLAVADSGRISVELNDLQQQSGGGCRAVFVLNNGFGKPLDKVAFSVVAFDAKQHASLFLSLDVGALPVGKTRVLRFDLGKDVACASLSRLVLDDVTSCEGGGITPRDCLAAVSLSSRTSAPLDF
jgi:hypothetical protein